MKTEKLTPKEKEAQQLIINEAEKVVNALVESFERVAEEWKTKSIPIDYIKRSRSTH